MVGGGQGAFIGAVHRMAARLDDQFELVCGAFSSNAERALHSGAALGVAPGRCYPDFETMIEREAAAAGGSADAVRRHRHAQPHAPGDRAAALEHGFHVLSDKPATATLAECRELAAKLRASDCSTD